VVSMTVASAAFPYLLSLTSTGFGKRSKTEEYRRTHRGAHGVRTIRTGGRNGHVVAVLPTRDDQELLVTTQRGVTIRAAVDGIRAQGRNTLGVRVIRLDEGDMVKDAVVLVPPGETPETTEPGAPPAEPGTSEPAAEEIIPQEPEEPDVPEPDEEPEDEDDASPGPG
jgi:DNA gyrase subunit A